MHIHILHADDDLIVINKPTGMSVHAPMADVAATDVVSVTKQQLGIDYLAIHQRLDRDTSGVMLFARRQSANAALAQAFEARTVTKRYQALVHGVPQARSGSITSALSPAKDGMMQIAPRGDARAQTAHTEYRVLATSPDKQFSLLEITPHTGRTHQIRVHLASIGHAVVGDVLYDQARPAPRLMLHASELSITQPTTNQPMTFHAPPPAIFQRINHNLPELTPNPQSRTASVSGLIELAWERRQPLRDDPSTTFFRAFHGSSDAVNHAWLKHWTVDRADDVLIASCYDEAVRTMPAVLRDSLISQWQPRSIYVKYRPKTAAHVDDVAMAELAPSDPIWGDPVVEIVVQENSVRYEIRPNDGLSVGLYADMRETRERVRRWVAGRTITVLNTFAYTCGFGMSALADAPQAHVTNLDLSQRSLEWGKINYQLNHLSVENYDFVFGDVFDWLARWARQGRTFDMVILDPPSFARNKGKRWRAEHEYAELAHMAARLMKPEGMLIACCNHAGLDMKTFRQHVEHGINSAGWHGTFVAQYSASMLDYPALYAPSHLKVMIVIQDESKE